MELKIYLWGIVVHILGTGAHLAIQKPKLTPAMQWGIALNIILWFVITPAYFYYKALRD